MRYLHTTLDSFIHFGSDILDINAWDVRMNQTFYPTLYREVPSLRHVRLSRVIYDSSINIIFTLSTQGADMSTLTPDEMRRMTAVFMNDWNVSSLVAISTILYHLAGTDPFGIHVQCNLICTACVLAVPD